MDHCYVHFAFLFTLTKSRLFKTNKINPRPCILKIKLMHIQGFQGPVRTLIIISITYWFYFTWLTGRIGQSPSLSRASPLLALQNFNQRFSGEKPWDFSPDENSPYFAPAATWDRTRDLPLSVEFRVVPTLLPVPP